MAQGPTGSATSRGLRPGAIINSRSVMNCYRTSTVRLAGGGDPSKERRCLSDDVNIAGRGLLRRKSDQARRRPRRAQGGCDPPHGRRGDDVARSFRPGTSGQRPAGTPRGRHQKFYAVRGSDLFHWYYLHEIHGSPFETGNLREIASVAAETLGLFVYGGDAIIGRDGSITIIDVNDWPSFAPVREEASRAIADLIFRKAQEHLSSHD